MVYLDKKAENLAPKSFAQIVNQVKDFYSYCVRYGFAKENPFEHFLPKVTY